MRSLKFPEDQQPVYLFTTGGVSFFEHPFHGDESPLLVKSPYTGAFLETEFYDAPDFFEVMDDDDKNSYYSEYPRDGSKFGRRFTDQEAELKLY